MRLKGLMEDLIRQQNNNHIFVIARYFLLVDDVMAWSAVIANRHIVYYNGPRTQHKRTA
jgi:hypothetical protein